MANYEVSYNISVNTGNATASLTAFSESVAKITNVFDTITAKAKALSKEMSVVSRISVDTSAAERKIDELLMKVSHLRQGVNIQITASGNPRLSPSQTQPSSPQTVLPQNQYYRYTEGRMDRAINEIAKTSKLAGLNRDSYLDDDYKSLRKNLYKELSAFQKMAKSMGGAFNPPKGFSVEKRMEFANHYATKIRENIFAEIDRAKASGTPLNPAKLQQYQSLLESSRQLSRQVDKINTSYAELGNKIHSSLSNVRSDLATITAPPPPPPPPSVWSKAHNWAMRQGQQPMMGGMVKGMLASMGIMQIFSSLAGYIRNSIIDSTHYDNVTQTTKNILGTHDTQPDFEKRFRSLSQLMRDVGVQTKFTATQVAEAGKYMAMAGLNLDQIKQSIVPISNIALIGDTDLGETADVMTNIMTAYDMKPEEMTRVSDILAMTFTKTNTSLMELAESFKYSGTLAHQAGISINEAAALFGIMGDAGIKASQAGTTLRMLIQNMYNPSKKQNAAWQKMGVERFDKDGKFRGMQAIFTDLAEKQKTMGKDDYIRTFMQMFRITAAQGGAAIATHTGKFADVINANNESGGLASQLADKKKNTIEGLWYQLTSSFQESGLKNFEAMRSNIRDFLKGMIKTLQSEDFQNTMRNFMNIVFSFAQSIGNVLKTFSTIWGNIPDVFKNFIGTFLEWKIYFSSFMFGFKSLAGLYSTGVVAFQKLQKAWIAATAILNARKVAKAASVAGEAVAGSGFAAGRTVSYAGSAAAGAAATGGASAAGGVAALLGGIGTGALITAGVVGALAVAGIAWYKYTQDVNQAKEATESFAKALKTNYSDTFEVKTTTDFQIASRNIANSMASQTDKIKAHVSALKQLSDATEGYQEIVDSSDKAIDNGKLYKAALEAADSWFGDYSTKEHLKSYADNGLYGEMMGKDGKKLPMGAGIAIDGKWYGGGGSGYDSRLQSLTAALDYVSSGEAKWVKALDQKLHGIITNPELNLEQKRAALNVAAFKNIPSVDSSVKLQSVSDFQDATEGQLLSYAPVNYILKTKVIPQMLDRYLKEVTYASNLEANDQAYSTSQFMQDIFSHFGTIAFASKLKWGTDKWIEEMYGRYEVDKNVQGAKYVLQDKIQKDLESLQLSADAIGGKFADMVHSLLGTLNNLSFITTANAKVPDFSIPTNMQEKGGPHYGEKRKGTDGKMYEWVFNGAMQKGGMWKLIEDNKAVNAANSNSNVSTTSTDPKPNKSHRGGGGKSGGSGYRSKHDQSAYKSHYNTESSAPKQVIVHIQNLMKVDKQQIDWNDPAQTAAISNIKQELATALLDVVQDFNSNII